MGKFKLYNVDLKNLTPGIHEFEYLLENKFFVDIDGDQVQKGKVKVNLTVKRSSMMFIALAIPMKHVHAPGKCNKAMSSKLKKHTARSTEDGDEEYEDDSVEEDIAIDDDVPVATDPRWDGLKGLLENDNN